MSDHGENKSTLQIQLLATLAFQWLLLNLIEDYAYSRLQESLKHVYYRFRANNQFAVLSRCVFMR